MPFSTSAGARTGMPEAAAVAFQKWTADHQYKVESDQQINLVKVRWSTGCIFLIKIETTFSYFLDRVIGVEEADRNSPGESR